LFRIDRNLVNLAAARSVQVDHETGDTEVGAVGATIDALTSATARAHQQAYQIVSEAEAKAIAEAMKIVAEAREEADELIRSAREQIAKERDAAKQKGYDEGAELGKRSYDAKLDKELRENADKLAAQINENEEKLNARLRESEEELSAKLRGDDEALGRVLGELQDERARTYAALEDEVIALALGIVRKILDPAEEDFGDVFTALIKSALKQMNPDGKVFIRLSTSDYERFFPSGGAAFELDNGAAVSAAIIKDTMLAEGDCIIDTNEATVNAGVDTQLRNIEIAFGKLKI